MRYSVTRRYAPLLAALVGAMVLAESVHADPPTADFNADGVTDNVQVTLGYSPSGPVVGRVRVVCGVHGTEILNIQGPQPDDAFGYDVDIAPDLNADGKPELIVSAPRAGLRTNRVGAVYVYSGAEGAKLLEFAGSRGDRFGFQAYAGQDLNQDGKADIFVEGMALDFRGVPVDRLLLFSGANGLQLFEQTYPIEPPEGMNQLPPAVLPRLTVWGDMNMNQGLDEGDVTLVEIEAAVGSGAESDADLDGNALVDEEDVGVLSNVMQDGGGPSDSLTPEQRQALIAVLGEWMALYPEDPITGVFVPGTWPRPGGATGGGMSWWRGLSGALAAENGRLVSSWLSVGEPCQVIVQPRGNPLPRAAGIGTPCCDPRIGRVQYPSEVRFTESFTCCAVGDWSCDQIYWVVSAGTFTDPPVYGSCVTVDTNRHFEAGLPAWITITVYCVKGGCTARYTFHVKVIDCDLQLAGCPPLLLAGQGATLTATGLPSGGTYSWSIVSGGQGVASYSANGNQFTFTTKGGAQGLDIDVVVRVVYTKDGCVKEQLCVVPIWADADQDGILDRDEAGAGCPFPGNPDSDGDGLLDGEEAQHGTDPCDPDTDDDGIVDGCEVAMHTDPVHTMDMPDMDMDHDGLLDIEEACTPGYGTSPMDPDTDGDGIWDGCEVFTTHTDPLDIDDPGIDADWDSDGLSDGQEACAGTDWQDEDSDDDGLLDGEDYGGTMSCLSPLNPDSDGDGLKDGAEFAVGTIACLFDTDGDGLADGFEYFASGIGGPAGDDPTRPWYLNPKVADTDGDGINDGNDDLDGDGLINQLEFRYGTAVNNPDSDGDGSSDGDEVGWGGCPTCASDGGLPPDPEDVVELRIHLDDQIGDGHNVSSWLLKVGEIRLPISYGGSLTLTEKFRRGQSYPISLTLIGTEPEYLQRTCKPDPDYRVTIEAVDGSLQPLVVIDDEQHLLGTHRSPEECGGAAHCNPAADKAATLHVLKLAIQADVQDQDDPSNTSYETRDDEVVPIYGGSEPGTSDNLKLSVVVLPEELASRVTRYEWSVTGPASSLYQPPAAGAGALLWDVGEVKLPPGWWIARCNVTLAGQSPMLVTRGLQQGIRTDDYIVIAWIDKTQVQLPLPGAGGFHAQLIEDLPVTGPVNPTPIGTLGLMSALLDGDISPYADGVTLNAFERKYILNWLFKFGGGIPDPATLIPGSDFRSPDGSRLEPAEVTAFLSDHTRYKLFNRLQLRYMPPSPGLPFNPTIIHRDALIGSSVAPFFAPGIPTIEPGQAAALNGTQGGGVSYWAQVNDGSPAQLAIQTMNVLTANKAADVGLTPLYWENIGSQIRFNISGSATTATVTVQPYPTYYIYRNGTLADTRVQALEPWDNFQANPYPFGTVSCPGSQTPGGRCGDAVSPAASSARTPPYIVLP